MSEAEAVLPKRSLPSVLRTIRITAIPFDLSPVFILREMVMEHGILGG